ncbi:MAG: methionine adenosyltransferase domain-containing protein [Nanoarchaeota archaeon]|nr:methionine adenosyltransferase domain-containing protein [Nanoarchaeota archaeon]
MKPQVYYPVHEAGRIRKPDKIEEQIALSVAAYILSISPTARFDLSVNGGWRDKKPVLFLGGNVSGEVCDTPNFYKGLEFAARRIYCSLYSDQALQTVVFAINSQTADLARNIEREGKVGDTGEAVAVAYRHTPYRLPVERTLASGLVRLFDEIYANHGAVPREFSSVVGSAEFYELRGDGKIGVRASYEGAKFRDVRKIILALQHGSENKVEYVRELARKITERYLYLFSERMGLQLGTPEIVVNNCGPFTNGGWRTDHGSREAKPHMQAFGSWGCLEDSLLGEDPSKPGLTATLAARWIAVQTVVAGVVPFVRVQLEYTIGKQTLDAVLVNTLGDGDEQERAQRWVNERFKTADLTLDSFIDRFGLREPKTYERILRNGGDLFDDCNLPFFDDSQLPWNRAE